MRKSMPALLLFAAALFFSCTKKDAVEPPADEPPAQPARVSHWRYFYTDGGGSIRLKSVDAVSGAPAVPFQPWTEAVRVADCGFGNGQAVFLINKCGLYPIQDLQSDAPLPIRHELFSGATAGDLYAIDGRYFIRIYQNSVFTAQNKAENTAFLLSTDSAAAAYTPAADVTDLHLPVEAQCKALEQVNGRWYASFKVDSGSEVSFFYLTCDDFAAFTQKDASEHIERISSEEFRNACEPAYFTGMPPVLKELAGKIVSNADVYLRVYTKDAPQGITFLKPAEEKDAGILEERVPLNAYAIYDTANGSGYRAAILLPDGTLLLDTDGEQGSQTLHLPSLPEHFSYTVFVISDTQITAAWEENIFYEMGRSGIFTAELQELGR